MAKYANVLSGISSIFGTPAWAAEGIKSFPANYVAVNAGTEFIRISVIPTGYGVNIKSISGVAIIDIFTPAGNGPKRPFEIADKLDNHLSNKSQSTSTGIVVQFGSSSLSPLGEDPENQSLYRTSYTIPFSYNEVM